ncbi:uncharacterized protein CDAR_190611, partial [Caerostris darwini]
TADWVPRFTDFVPSEISDHYDPSFTPVLCFVKKTRGLATLPNLQVYPPKGFSHLFFPVSKFDPALYLPPMVAVKLNRVPRAVNVTVECSLVTPDAYLLWNNGKAVVTFRTA